MEGVAATFHATKPTTTPQATVSMEEFSSLKTEVAELREMFVPVKQAAITLTASIDGNGKEKEIDPERLAEAINVFRQISQSQRKSIMKVQGKFRKTNRVQHQNPSLSVMVVLAHWELVPLVKETSHRLKQVTITCKFQILT